MAAGRVRELLAVYAEAEDLISIGAYKSGSNPRVDWAIAHLQKARSFLRQPVGEHVAFDVMEQELKNLVP